MSDNDAITTCVCFFFATVAIVVWFLVQDERAASYRICAEATTAQSERIECAKAVYADPPPPPPASPDLLAILQARRTAFELCATTERNTPFEQRSACYDRVYGDDFDVGIERWLPGSVPAPPTPVQAR